MAVTFLQTVNDTLKRVRVIQGDAGELATSTVTSTATGLVATDAFTDSNRQVQIDLAIQLWQEAAQEIFSLGIFPEAIATATVALVANQAAYSLPSDFERMAGVSRETRVWRGVTNGLLVYEYPGGYSRLVVDHTIATDYIGDPNYWAIDPVSLRLVFDTYPATGQAGNSYHALYHKRISLTSTMATSTLPFSDTVASSLVPVVAEAWNRIMKKEFDAGMFRAGLVRAAKTVTRTGDRSRYGIRRVG